MWGQILVESNTSAFTAWHPFHRTACYTQSDNLRVTAVTSHDSQEQLVGEYGSQSGSSSSAMKRYCFISLMNPAQRCSNHPSPLVSRRVHIIDHCPSNSCASLDLHTLLTSSRCDLGQVCGRIEIEGNKPKTLAFSRAESRRYRQYVRLFDGRENSLLQRSVSNKRDNQWCDRRVMPLW
jgi:hypothetical protein